MSLKSIEQWLDDRLGLEEVRAPIRKKTVPVHRHTIWYYFGGMTLFFFIVQVVTGILLAIYYNGSAEGAYESVTHITNVVPFGWFIRSLHKWAATLMIAAVILHQMRVFFTGAYRNPREINWVVGMCLLLCVLGTGFTGYSLVYEQLSFWGATVGANISDTVPFIGGFIKRMMLAGDAYNQSTLSRFFVLHAAILPVTIVFLLAIHITVIRMQGVTEFQFKDEDEDSARTFNFFPDHLYTELIIGLVLMIVLSALATILPATLGPEANPLQTPEVIKPEWFFYVAFRWLKLFTGTAAVLSMGFIVFVMFAWPWIDNWIRKHTRFQEASVWIGILGVVTIVGLTLWEAFARH